MFSKLRFSKFNKFVTRSVFGELQLTQILNFLKLLVATLKLEVLHQNSVWLFYYFNFKRNYDVLKSKSTCILLNKNTNFNKNETESKRKNPTYAFRQRNLSLQLIQRSQMKSRTDELELRKEKRGHFLYRLFCPIFFKNICFRDHP